MKQKTWKAIQTILSIIVVLALFILSMACITYYHEAAHQQIFNSYHINSTVEYDFLWLGGRTIAVDGESCLECKALNNWNDIIGYNIMAFVISLWCLLWAYLIWTKSKEKKGGKK